MASNQGFNFNAPPRFNNSPGVPSQHPVNLVPQIPNFSSINQNPVYHIPPPPPPPPQNFTSQYPNSLPPNFPFNLTLSPPPPIFNVPSTLPNRYPLPGTNPPLLPPYPNQGPTLNKDEGKYSAEKLKCLVKGKFIEYLQSKYECKLEILGGKVSFISKHQNLSEVKAELEQKLNSLKFDTVGEWFYLDNTGLYVKYNDGICQLIEEAYKRCFLLLGDPSYIDYEEKVDFELNDRWYSCHFAKLGKPHLQMFTLETSIDVQENLNVFLEAKDVEEYKFDHTTIRIIMRKGQDEELKVQTLDYDWKWLHESKKFKSYSYESNCIIEYGYKSYLSDRQKNRFIIIQGVNGIAYQINFNDMTQFNEKTRFVRSIRRDHPLNS